MEALGVTAGGLVLLIATGVLLILVVLGILLPFFVYRIAGDVRQIREELVREARAQTALMRRQERDAKAGRNV